MRQDRLGDRLGKKHHHTQLVTHTSGESCSCTGSSMSQGRVTHGAGHMHACTHLFHLSLTYTGRHLLPAVRFTTEAVPAVMASTWEWISCFDSSILFLRHALEAYEEEENLRVYSGLVSPSVSWSPSARTTGLSSAPYSQHPDQEVAECQSRPGWPGQPAQPAC